MRFFGRRDPRPTEDRRAATRRSDDEFRGCAATVSGAAFQAALIDPSLDRDVRFRFELEVALPRVLAVVILERALDIDRMSVMPFDQVAVVAVHRPHQIGERGQQAFGQGAAKSSTLRPDQGPNRSDQGDGANPRQSAGAPSRRRFRPGFQPVQCPISCPLIFLHSHYVFNILGVSVAPFVAA